MENQNAEEEKVQAEKRRQFQSDLRAARAQNADAAPEEGKTRQDMDTLLQNLRDGVTVGRKSRRNRADAGRQSISAVPLQQQLTGEGEAADKAKDMLAALKKEGFGSASASTSSASVAGSSKPRRTRLRGSLRPDEEGSSPRGSEHTASNHPTITEDAEVAEAETTVVPAADDEITARIPRSRQGSVATTRRSAHASSHSLVSTPERDDADLDKVLPPPPQG